MAWAFLNYFIFKKVITSIMIINRVIKNNDNEVVNK